MLSLNEFSFDGNDQGNVCSLYIGGTVFQ